MVMDTVRVLARELRESAEYTEFVAARERALENGSTRALYAEYRRAQMLAQADAVAGRRDEKSLARLQALGEALQFDEDAAALLFAEYRLTNLLGEIYRLLAEAAEVDLDMLEP